ncbi:MAG TPA: tetratricopeptide repeat protein [Terriglobia bacterium]|nr:tetratricopeptide repeat protein [Terriglobia bacterium]
MTHARSMGRIALMRLAWTIVAIFVIWTGFAAPAGLAQDDEVWKDSEPEAQPYVPPPAWKSVEVGDFYLRRKKYRAALSRYKEAVKVDPYYALGYLGLGKVYDKIGLKERALESYRKYLEMLPSTKQAEEAKEVHEAIARLERKLKKSKGSRPAQPASPDTASSSSPD